MLRAVPFRIMGSRDITSNQRGRGWKKSHGGGLEKIIRRLFLYSVGQGGRGSVAINDICSCESIITFCAMERFFSSMSSHMLLRYPFVVQAFILHFHFVHLKGFPPYELSYAVSNGLLVCKHSHILCIWRFFLHNDFSYAYLDHLFVCMHSHVLYIWRAFLQYDF